VAGQQFFQKHDEKSSIPGLKALDPTIWPGHPGLLEIDTAEGLVSAAQMNVVEFHTWNSTSKKLNTPDRMIFDLDPGEGVKWKSIQEAALLTRSLLSELGLESWLKTSGGKGLHVVVPIAPRRDYDTVRDFSAAIVQHLAQTIPARFVAKSGASNRVGKIYVDYLRNNFGQTTAAAFSARARPGLGVSMPIGWEDLESLKSASQWTIATAREYLSFQKDDPWKAYWTSSQLLTAPMKRLGFTPKARKA
jgi:bifunctional non-homologous end joining protein LigD